MTSLDGYSLNQKMDDQFDKIKEEIEVLKFRIETEMTEFKQQFQALTKVLNKDASSSKKKKR